MYESLLLCVLMSLPFEFVIWALARVNLSLGFANINGADQPVYQRRLISAFVIHILESIISNLAAGEISIF